MGRLRSVILSTLLAVAVSIESARSVAAFAPSPLATAPSQSRQQHLAHSASLRSPRRRVQLLASDGSMAAPSQSTMRGGAAAMDPAAKAKKVRIAAFDSMRFFLIAIIVLGHFIRFAGPSDTVLRLVSQHNVAVGAFFALSGYVAAYTSTENGQRRASAKMLETPRQKWILQRVFGYLPLHLVTLLVFAPVFLYADVTYNGWPTAALHGLLSATLTQAWFPQHAEVWNAPTWFLSALSFATAVLPFALPALAAMTKRQLRRTAVWLWIVYFLPKLGYLYDFNAWAIFEGVASPKAHPNLAVFNLLRFSPLFCVAEVLLGAAACRLVMLDGADGEEAAPRATALSTLLPAALLAAALGLRAVPGAPELSDLLVRGAVFLPLFLRLLMAVHRGTVAGAAGAGHGRDPLVALLSRPALVGLGQLSFPIFIVHGPVGQIFYKKIIATKLFGRVLMGPANFGLYLATVLAAAYVMQKTVLQSKRIADWSARTVDKWSQWM